MSLFVGEGSVFARPNHLGSRKEPHMAAKWAPRSGLRDEITRALPDERLRVFGDQVRNIVDHGIAKPAGLAIKRRSVGLEFQRPLAFGASDDFEQLRIERHAGVYTTVWLKGAPVSADEGSVSRRILPVYLALWLALWAGCGTTLSSGGETPSPAGQPAALAPSVRALRVSVAEDVAIVVEGNVDPGLKEHLKAALQAELGRVGLSVARTGDKTCDLTLRIDTRVTGAMSYLRGRVGLSAEKGGVTVAMASTDIELHGNHEFSDTMTRKAVEQLLHTPALVAFADKTKPSHELNRPKPVVQAAPSKPTRNPTAEAKAHAQRGTSMYNLGRFPDALAEYEAAYLAVQDPPFLFNIAQCHRKMGKNKEALESYRAYLRVAPDAPNRPEVQKRVSELERQVHAAR